MFAKKIGFKKKNYVLRMSLNLSCSAIDPIKLRMKKCAVRLFAILSSAISEQQPSWEDSVQIRSSISELWQFQSTCGVFSLFFQISSLKKVSAKVLDACLMLTSCLLGQTWRAWLLFVCVTGFLYQIREKTCSSLYNNWLNPINTIYAVVIIIFEQGRIIHCIWRGQFCIH